MSSPSYRPSLLVVDDDASVRDALAVYLEGQGFNVCAADGGRQMDQALAQGRADVVVLDLMMPGEDGLSICRRLTAKGQAVIILSAMGETTDRIVGLEIGAADYLAKPFEPRELVARIRAVLRSKSAIALSDDETLEFAGWRLTPGERALLDPGGQPVALTSGEYNLLRVFVDNPRRVLSRDRLLDLVHGPTATSFDRAVDLSVSRLRRKLGRDSQPALIETIRGEGYRFVAQVRRS